MSENEKCIRCGSTVNEIKTIALPTKKTNEINVSVDIFYLKICLDCGYTEMYSAKAMDKKVNVVPKFKA